MDILITFALAIAKLASKRIQGNMPAYVHNFMKDVTAVTVRGKVYHANAQKPMQIPVKENINTNMKDMVIENTLNTIYPTPPLTKWEGGGHKVGVDAWSRRKIK